MLDWQVNDAPVCECELDALWPSEAARQYAEIRNENRDPLPPPRLAPIPSWVLVPQYQLNRDIRLNAGISNLFDKQLYRENAGASTYNEPGRAYYAGVTLSF
ncbi:TonB-dependent receptor [Klebsiella pneumoniae]|nr:TonB-dependent receptor [Klebsiella pneumoniae]